MKSASTRNKIIATGAIITAIGICFLAALPSRLSPPLQCGPGSRLPKKDRLDLRIVFGYKDARPARFVGDRYERLALIETILKPCMEGRFDCGFIRSPEDADLFEKRMLGSDGRIRKIALKVLASSAGPDDQENRTNPFQKWKSNQAKQAFLDGLKQADLVFYDGHSRDGGGPDFTPPRLNKNKHVDYAWYKVHAPGLQEMRAATEKHTHSTKIVGLYSCVSNRLAPSAKIIRGVEWITYNKLYYFADALRDMENTLSSVLDGKCAPPSPFSAVKVMAHSMLRIGGTEP